MDVFEMCRKMRGVDYCTRCSLVKRSLADCPIWARWLQERGIMVRRQRKRLDDYW